MMYRTMDLVSCKTNAHLKLAKSIVMLKLLVCEFRGAGKTQISLMFAIHMAAT
jgi:hypothetical protein